MIGTRIALPDMPSPPAKLRKSFLVTTRWPGGKNNTYLIYGRTLAGRCLLVVLAPRPRNVFYPVTARDMTAKERRLFLR